ncbi:MAG: PAS domain S-box protein [Chloroflexi bacterium]|nr:PAS domain S-box protein [Chloroflexota bacterium]
MVNRIRAWLAPPDYDDEQLNQRAEMVNYVLAFVFFSLLILLTLTPLEELRKPSTYGTFIVFFSMVLAGKLLLNAGWMRLGVLLLLGLPWGMLFFLAILTNGIQNISLYTLLPLVLAAGLLAGPREALLMGAASILGLSALIALQDAGMIPLSYETTAPWLIALRYGVNLLLATLILFLSTRNTNRAFQKMRGELRMRQDFQASVLRQANELQLLHAVRTALARQDDLPSLIHNVVSAIQDTFGYTLVSLYLLDGDTLKLQHQVGYEKIIEEIPITQGVCGRVVRSGKPELVEDVRQDADFLGAIEDLSSEVCVPLFDGDEVVGILNVESGHATTLGERDLRLMEALGEHVSLALERAHILERLQKSEERYRTVSELASDYAFSLRRVGKDEFRFEWVTEAYARVTGYSLEEMLAIGDPANIILPEDVAEVERLNAELAAGETASGEYRIRTKDGEVRWIRSVNRPLFEDGEWVGILGASRDVTWDVEAEQTVRASEYRYRALFERSNDAVFIINLESTITQANQRAAEMLGCDVADLVGRKSNDFLAPEERPRADRRLKELMESGVVPVYERTFIRKDGSRMPAEMNVALVRDPLGNPMHIQSVVRDITERKEAEKRLEEERNLLMGLINAIPDGLYAKDRECRFIIANEAVTRGLGLADQDAIIGKHDRDLMDAELAERYHKEELRVMKTGVPLINKEETWVDKGSQQQWTLTSKVPLRDSQGEVIGTVGATRQITDIKQAEIAMRESEYRFRSVFEQSNDGILISTIDGQRVAVNQRAAEQLGYTIEEVMAMPMNAAVSAEEKAAADKTLARARAGEKIPPYERTAVRKDGREVILEMNISLIRDSAGKPLFVQTIARDITERHQQVYERERLLRDLQRQTNRLQTAVEISSRTISLLEPGELIRQAVELIAERFGFYYVGLFLVDAPRKYAVLAAGSGEAGRQMLASGHHLRVGGESMIGWCVANKQARIALDVGEDAVHFENPFLPKTRSEMALPLSARGEVLGALTVQSEVEAAFTEDDIAALQAMSDQLASAIENARLYEESQSELKRREKAEREVRKLNTELERRVEQRTAQLQAANRELESFAYTVSHDLRAPLRAIGGYASILLEDYGGQFEDQPGHYLGQIRSNIERMGLLIDGLLAFSRLGRQQIKRQPVALRSIVKNVVEDLTPETKDRKIKFKVGRLPVVQADPTLIRQVYANLLGNAVKFTRSRAEAEIAVGVQKREGESVFFVRDNGVGFDLKYVDKLFGVFQRLHPLQEYEGTGVGLAIVQRIVNRHGGRIWAEAVEGEGAAFYFTLGQDGDEDGESS